MRRQLSCAAAVTAAALAVAAPAGAANWTAGAPGAGDPFFPQAGNGGYDVRHYALDLGYDPATGILDGSARITLVPTQDLDQLNLDLRDWFEVSRVAVGKHRAAYLQQDEQELVVTPRPKLHAGRAYTVEVDYDGVPEDVVDPDGSSEGWVKNADGAFVVNEPQGAPGWFPGNDDPNDKATYDFAITVPQGRVAIANGRLLLVGDRRRQDDVALARGLADGLLPHDGDQRRLRSHGAGRAERAADLQRDRLGGRFTRHRRLQRGAEGDGRDAVRAAARGHRVLRRRLRRLSLHQHGRGHRPGPRRLRARVPDQADVRRRAEREHARARDRAPVVRRQRDALGVAGHLAQRGLRDAGRSGSGASAGAARARRPCSTSSTPRRRRAASGSSRPPPPPGRRTCSTAGSTPRGR